jgi:hypothetical protein
LVDRRLIGVLVVAAILSTAFTVLFFSETTEEKMEIVKDYWQTSSLEGWQRLPMAEKIIPYTLSIIMKKPVREISIRFGVLRNRTLDVNYTGWESLSLEERAIRVGDLGYLDARASEVSEKYDVDRLSQRTDLTLGGEERRILVLDYYPCMEALAPETSSIEIPYLFVFVFDLDGNITQYYSGYWDFFDDRARSIQGLTIQLNENSTRYANEQNMAAGSIPVRESLPLLGEVVFEELRPDDRIFVTYRISGGGVLGEQAVMQLIRIRLDGEYLDPLVNVLKRV